MYLFDPILSGIKVWFYCSPLVGSKSDVIKRSQRKLIKNNFYYTDSYRRGKKIAEKAIIKL